MPHFSPLFLQVNWGKEAEALGNLPHWQEWEIIPALLLSSRKSHANSSTGVAWPPEWAPCLSGVFTITSMDLCLIFEQKYLGKQLHWGRCHRSEHKYPDKTISSSVEPDYCCLPIFHHHPHQLLAAILSVHPTCTGACGNLRGLDPFLGSFINLGKVQCLTSQFFHSGGQNHALVWSGLHMCMHCFWMFFVILMPIHDLQK